MSPFQIALNLVQRAHTARGGVMKGEKGFCAIIAKKRVSSPKSGYSKNRISGSQERWTLGTLETWKQSRTLSPFINISPGSQQKKTIFNTSAPGALEESKIWPKSQYRDGDIHGTPEPI